MQNTIAVNDIFGAYGYGSATVGISGAPLTLPGVPVGIRVHVKGYCNSGVTQVLVQDGRYGGGLSLASGFAPTGTFAFDAYTNVSAQITATASVSTTVKCYATQWAWERGA